jgi:transcriptional regulator with XRE-family HTH domain
MGKRIQIHHIDDEITFTVCTFINDRMKEKRIKQQILADMTGMTQGAISDILRAKKRLSIVTLNKIIVALNCTIILQPND